MFFDFNLKLSYFVSQFFNSNFFLKTFILIIKKIKFNPTIYFNKNYKLVKYDSQKKYKNYSNYIKNYIAPDDKNLGYKKIIKTIKNRFF